MDGKRATTEAVGIMHYSNVYADGALSCESFGDIAFMEHCGTSLVWRKYGAWSKLTMAEVDMIG
jgi:hypothetical protein